MLNTSRSFSAAGLGAACSAQQQSTTSNLLLSWTDALRTHMVTVKVHFCCANKMVKASNFSKSPKRQKTRCTITSF